MVDEIPSDTSRVEGIAGGRTCPKCGVTKQWRQGNWVCLNHDNATPADWKHPMSGGLVVKGGLGEKDKVEIVKEEVQTKSSIKVHEVSKQTVNETTKDFLVTIPVQAREIFNKLVWNTIEVKLRKVDAENLLTLLEDMETPQKMSDAKAIIRLVDQLDGLIKKETEND